MNETSKIARCESCRHWREMEDAPQISAPPHPHPFRPYRAGVCKLSEEITESDPRFMFPVSDTGPRGTLVTAPAFGCVLHELQPLDDARTEKLRDNDKPRYCLIKTAECKAPRCACPDAPHNLQATT
jgi:hypothetical protein